MAEIIKAKDVAGQCFYVRDCYVWAEIFYLDSPTDYREYLSQNKKKPVAGESSIMLDDASTTIVRKPLISFPVAVLLCFAIAGYLLYLIL
jgi:hypothetical protein